MELEMVYDKSEGLWKGECPTCKTRRSFRLLYRHKRSRKFQFQCTHCNNNFALITEEEWQ